MPAVLSRLSIQALRARYIAWPWQHKNIFFQAFRSVPGCQTCMCKRSIYTHCFILIQGILIKVFKCTVVHRAWMQGRRQKYFQGGINEKKTIPKNSIIMPLSTLSISCIKIQGGRFRYSFICLGTSTRRQRSVHFGLRVKLPPVTTSLTTQK